MLDSNRRFPLRGGRAWSLVGLGLAGLVVLAGCGRPPSRTDGGALEKGRNTYVRYCTSCHGKEGRGDGPLAADLSMPVSDMTMLAARNGGTYPEERVTQVLAKGGTVRGHGNDDMPAWGPAFNRSGGTDATTVDEAFRNLNTYLRSIQRSK